MPNPKTILVVDDDKDVRKLVDTALSNAGYKVLTAYGVDNALNVMDSEGFPDLIITDLMMPDKDGYELVSELKGKNYTNPIIVISAKKMDDLERDRLGVNWYLRKPFSLQFLINIAGQLIGEAGPIDL